MVRNKPEGGEEYTLNYKGRDGIVSCDETKDSYIFLSKTRNPEVYDIFLGSKENIFVLGKSVVSAIGFIHMNTTRELVESGELINKLEDILRFQK